MGNMLILRSELRTRLEIAGQAVVSLSPVPLSWHVTGRVNGRENQSVHLDVNNRPRTGHKPSLAAQTLVSYAPRCERLEL